ncbi:hypothetical protein GCM10011508_03780 [Flavobacterium lutivivi]|nr:hypothetical protein GCM10011508_03780 [Flavobacterium lutivivi]
MKVYFNLFFLFAVITCNAQFDTNKKVLNIAPVTSSSGQVSTTSSSSIKYPSIFDKKDKLLESVSLLKKKEENQKSVMEKENFQNPSKEYTDRMNKKGDGEILEKYKSDSFLGQFRTGTKIVSIACRDHEAPDGDVVRIWLNDKIVVDAILLDVDFKEIYLDLEEGINKIEIEALNQGESGPNTAQFVINDQKKGMITTNKWNLTTGVKAKLIILKENNTLEKKE